MTTKTVVYDGLGFDPSLRSDLLMFVGERPKKVATDVSLGRLTVRVRVGVRVDPVWEPAVKITDVIRDAAFIEVVSR